MNRPLIFAHHSKTIFTSTRYITACFAFALISSSILYADVVSDNDVTPIDFIFTTSINEGLPGNGNELDGDRIVIDPFGAIIAFLPQISWEGREDRDNDQNINEHVIVGGTGTGRVQITSGSELRFMDLIIGGNRAGGGSAPYSVGTVEITGAGSLYNNDIRVIFPETIVPPGSGLPAFPDPLSVNPREAEADAAFGFDLRMGTQSGASGHLSLTAGGGAQIHDSVVIGEAAGGFGTVFVDGFASSLVSGGFAQPDMDDPHMFIVGQLGNGTLDIRNAGRVISTASTEGSVGEAIFGAAIGDSPDIQSGTLNESPLAGGTGIAYVDGVGSLWAVTGGLIVGGFANARDATAVDDANVDVEGNDVRYGANIGSGTLVVSNGGQVSIVTPVDNTGPTEFESNLWIGRKGTIQLETGGRVSVGSTPLRDENVVLVNDGMITGNGRIDTGIFRNRLFGEVKVGLNETLQIDSGSFVQQGDLGSTLPVEELPLLNYGTISVLDGEFIVTRAEDAGGEQGANPSDPQQFTPFINAAIPQAIIPPDEIPISRRVGEITSSNGVMRFATNLSNQGILSFTAGDNEVYGDVVNEGPDPINGFPPGIISVTGNETTATIHGLLTNNGIVDIGPNATLFSILGDLILGTTSSLGLTLGGGESGQAITRVTVLDDATLDGLLQVDLFQTGANPIMPMDGDSYTILTANTGFTGDFTAFDLPFLGPGLGWIPDNNPAGIYTLRVASTAGVIGGDLNGDGIVDADDLSIWLANEGNPGGLGDINMDGIVDGLDLAIIQMQFGGPPSGTATGSLASNVPEPASGLCAMLAVMGVLFCRRKNSEQSC